MRLTSRNSWREPGDVLCIEVGVAFLSLLFSHPHSLDAYCLCANLLLILLQVASSHLSRNVDILIRFAWGLPHGPNTLATTQPASQTTNHPPNHPHTQHAHSRTMTSSCFYAVVIELSLTFATHLQGFLEMYNIQ